MNVPDVTSFLDTQTNNISHVATDLETGSCAIIDPLLDYDQASGRSSTRSADKIAEHVKTHGLTVEWIIDTHIHADHLSAGHYLRSELGGKLAIGEHISEVQKVFGKLFNADEDFRLDGSQFDHLFRDGETYKVGNIDAKAIHTPGHTPACMTHLIGDAAFVGDTLFMPDYGTARCDFPGGDARTLFRSIQRIFELPDDTRMFLNHDYLPEGRDELRWISSVGEQRRSNIHVREGISEDEFVAMRTKRDATLATPKLMIPSVQVNMRAGNFPEPESNGIRYIKVPVDTL
ncbi:MBL fold metallo-hydrolase [Erythrobacter sp. KY5]|uniref:MBL fold metallo-hydrolase n=1 Tax=Erythrobacter sp. KY5 TaxID=2011159 RepID=UPI000DBEF7DC|nr:MBL fold metallo-hydrolase [Erythrobacter sp. KY5]AWW74459.1 MBL fold metallo-hydrolase [Erythrobacter sp. KY5]